MSKSRENLSNLVSRKLRQSLCESHGKPLEKVNMKDLSLQCVECAKFSKENSEDLLIDVIEVVKNPIKLALSYSKSPSALPVLEHAYQQNDVKIGFEKLVEDLRNKMNTYCDKLLKNFEDKWKEAFLETFQCTSELDETQNNYRSVFEELLETNFSDGTPEEFENILKEFCGSYSYDPTEYVQERVTSINSAVENMPLIDWTNLEKLYQQVTDPWIWETEKIVKNSRKGQRESGELMEKSETFCNSLVLLPEIVNVLKNQSFSLKYTSSKVTLYSNLDEELNQVCELEETFDAFYETPKSTLVGVNYEGITFFTYSMGTLLKTSHFPIKSCSSLILFDCCMILESENRIIRVWFDGCKEVICLSGSELKYQSENNAKNNGNFHKNYIYNNQSNEGYFEYNNRKGERIVCHAYHSIS